HRHLGAESAAVADRGADFITGAGGDDDADLADSGSDQRLDSVEEDWLVRYWHKLLGRRVGDRSQSRASAAGKDQTAHRLHLQRRLQRQRAYPPALGGESTRVFQGPSPAIGWVSPSRQRSCRSS